MATTRKYIYDVSTKGTQKATQSVNKLTGNFNKLAKQVGTAALEGKDIPQEILDAENITRDKLEKARETLEKISRKTKKANKTPKETKMPRASEVEFDEWAAADKGRAFAVPEKTIFAKPDLDKVDDKEYNLRDWKEYAKLMGARAAGKKADIIKTVKRVAALHKELRTANPDYVIEKYTADEVKKLLTIVKKAGAGGGKYRSVARRELATELIHRINSWGKHAGREIGLSNYAIELYEDFKSGKEIPVEILKKHRDRIRAVAEVRHQDITAELENYNKKK